MKKSLAIITARGGSKRIPRKNIKEFLGSPIIKYSIDAAIGAGCFDEVMVSTDDDEIAEVAKKFGAAIPFKRSVNASNDYATSAEVILEVLDSYKKQEVEFEYVCCIYPTAPFITALKLRKAYDMLVNSNATSVLPVVKFGFPILRSFKIEDGLVNFIHEKKLFTSSAIPFEMPESEVQDIDNEEDWKIAEIKYTFLKEKFNQA